MKFDEKSELVYTVPKYQNCFVYFLLKDNEVVYVGQTENGLRRPLSHTDKDFDEIKIIYCNGEDLDLTEDTYIQKYKPLYNKCRNYAVCWGVVKSKKLYKKANRNTKLFNTESEKTFASLGNNARAGYLYGKIDYNF